ncbi:MAG TPA: DUF5009 domain-containing protein [Planctomycetota bacterium]|nr:DUF5009 domain-containing protein [Planctomycetota bacterium]
MTDDAGSSGGSERLLSLDAFRGLTVAAMVAVNNPGAWGEASQYAALRHAPWHGCTPTDLVFPFFLFILGAAIPFSRGAPGDGSRAIALRILRRTVLLFALGLLLRAFPRFDLEGIRIPGVLQRIAVVYLVAALLVRNAPPRLQALAAAGLLLGYWALLALVPVPGGSAGVLEKTGNLVAWLDVALLRGHLYEPAWDPEGILSTIPAIGTALLGALAGGWLRSDRPATGKAVGLIGAGLAAAALGGAWGAVFPINKNLWTSSYALFTAGLASAGLGLLHWIADARGVRAWATPFAVFGTNAIASFVLSTLAAKTIGWLRWRAPDDRAIDLKTWLWREVFQPLGPPKAASLAFALAYTAVFWLAMLPLYRRRIFLKV